MVSVSLAKVQRAVRRSVCVRCFARPRGSEELPGNVARACEPTCQVFINLPKLLDIVGTTHEPTIEAYERATQEMVCQSCRSSPTSGDYCSERSTARCPLAVYLADVVDVVERVA